jgi:transposase
MQVMSEGCAGLDVHKKTVVACVLTHATQETRTFGMMTADLLPLRDWLLARGCTRVAIKSTGDDWKAVFNILEGAFEVLLVNAQHVKEWPAPLVNSREALVLSLRQPPWILVEKLSQESPTAVPLPHPVFPRVPTAC